MIRPQRSSSPLWNVKLITLWKSFVIFFLNINFQSPQMISREINFIKIHKQMNVFRVNPELNFITFYNNHQKIVSTTFNHVNSTKFALQLWQYEKLSQISITIVSGFKTDVVFPIETLLRWKLLGDELNWTQQNSSEQNFLISYQFSLLWESLQKHRKASEWILNFHHSQIRVIWNQITGIAHLNLKLWKRWRSCFWIEWWKISLRSYVYALKIWKLWNFRLLATSSTFITSLRALIRLNTCTLWINAYCMFAGKYKFYLHSILSINANCMTNLNFK